VAAIKREPRLRPAALTLLAAVAWCAAVSPAPAQDLQAAPEAAAPSPSQSLKLFVYDSRGHLMSLEEFLKFTGRADRSPLPGQGGPAVMAYGLDGLSGQKPAIAQSGPWLSLSWTGAPRISIALTWPIPGDGFSTVLADNGGAGFGSGDAVYLNEEIAFTEYRLFRDAWFRHLDSMRPPYIPSRKAKRLAAKAEKLIFETKASKSGATRAAEADQALQTTALAWERMLFEHGLQIADDAKRKSGLRFGVTLDATIVDRLPDYQKVIKTLKDAGVNWVRLAFAPNPSDFIYSQANSFNTYDAVVQELNREGIKVMGCVLDSANWPAGLTPKLYTARAKNLALHYEGLIPSWEVGNEINGDWLGGMKAPLSTDQAFAITQAAAAELKGIDPRLETVATLYWWGPTAPDFAHSLNGWLSRYAPQGFGQNIDAVALSLEPEDNPVGVAFESIFKKTAEFLPGKKLMIGDFEYGQSGRQRGYWWLKPDDIDGAREDLVSLYTPASCAVPQSVCGGFFWYALEQMLPPGGRPTRLFRVYQESLRALGR